MKKFEEKNLSPFIRLLIKLGCVNMPRPRNKKIYWLTKSGIPVATSESVIVNDADKISKHRYYEIKKERKHQQDKLEQIATNVSKNGCYIDEEDNVWI